MDTGKLGMREVPTREKLLEKLKGTQSGKYRLFSIIPKNIIKLVASILLIAGERGYVGNDLTPEDCRAVLFLISFPVAPSTNRI